ncbi:MAG: hypothetical protein IJM45_05055 [Clostridia bacterium]|nr:hypothetical protein [Clostridia bacterium]
MNDIVLKYFLIEADSVISLHEEEMISEDPTRAELSSEVKIFMEELCRRMSTGKYRRVYGKARIILIAAIILVFVITVTAGAVWYTATVRYDNDWGDNLYHVEGGQNEGIPANSRPSFIPDRFTDTVSETLTDVGYQLVMSAGNGDVLAVTVRTADNDHLFDAERGENDWIEVDGEQYFRHRSQTETKPTVYEVTLFISDDRYTVNVSEWSENGYASDSELALIIQSIHIW